MKRIEVLEQVTSARTATVVGSHQGKVRVGVIGAGVFGGYHANKYTQLPQAKLAAVFDLDLERARALALPLGAAAFDDYAAFLEAVDVVTVATPAVAHAQPALDALRAGKPTYVEKPLAVTAADADALVAQAAAERQWAPSALSWESHASLEDEVEEPVADEEPSEAPETAQPSEGQLAA